MCLLWAVNAFLSSPTKVLPARIIPVETIVLREEPLPPEPKPTISQHVLARKALEAKSQKSTRKEPDLRADDMVGPLPKEGDFQPSLAIDQVSTPDVYSVSPEQDRKALETKSQISAGTEARIDVSDLAGPIPKEGSFEPSLSVRHSPELGGLPRSREGEEVASKPTVSTFEMPPLSLSPVQPSRSDEPPPLEVEIPRVLTEAETGGPDTYSQTIQKIEAPIGRNRPSTHSVSDLPPIPTIESPSIPEQKEMILAAPNDLPLEGVARAQTRRQVRSDVEPRLLARKRETADDPTFITPKKEPTTLDLDTTPSFPFPGSAKGAAFLFVLDTSGSVKGPPLEGIKSSARQFVSLMGEKDRVGVMTFNDITEMVAAFTSEKELLGRKINSIQTAGTRTVLFDALMRAIHEIETEDRESKFVILFSDGKDEGSRSTPDEVIKRARASQISIFCLGYSRVERTYLGTLDTISQGTGGIFAEAPLFEEIVELLGTVRDARAQTGS